MHITPKGKNQLFLRLIIFSAMMNTSFLKYFCPRMVNICNQIRYSVPQSMIQEYGRCQ